MMFLLLWGCQQPVWCSASGNASHTQWDVRWREASCDATEAALTARMAGLLGRLSIWEPASELVALHRATGPTEVSEEAYEVVQAALDLATASEGAFDPTLQPLMLAWGHHGDGTPTQPAPDALEAALERVGYRAVLLDRELGIPRIDPRGRELDLSAVLDGHAADALSEVLSRRGIGSHLVVVDGEMRAMGEGPDGAWRLGLPHQLGTYRVTNVGVATSSGDGTVLDPATGLSASTDARAVVVIARTAREADGLATAVRVLGRDRGMALIERTPGAEASILDATGGSVHSSTMPAREGNDGE